MRSVVVVGAGGSLADALSYRPRQFGAHPPLDADFFAKAESIAASDTQVRDARDALRGQLDATNRFYDPWSPGSPASLEQFFADIYYDVSSGGSGAFDAYVDVLRLYQVVIAATTNWMAGSNRRIGALGKLLRGELKRSDPDQLTVITFNQDLVLENVIARLPRKTQTWCLRALYADPRLTDLPAQGLDTFPLHDDSCDHDTRIQLLKLHGSMNWGVRSRNQRPTRNALFPAQRDREIFCWNPKAIYTQASLSGGGQGRRNWYLWPLVVPPIYDKQRLVGTSVIQDMWDKATRAVERADRLLIVGYSLPEADVLARQMLRRAFAVNPLQAVHCVNPDSRVAQKLKQSLDARVVYLYHDLPTFLASGN